MHFYTFVAQHFSIKIGQLLICYLKHVLLRFVDLQILFEVWQ